MVFGDSNAYRPGPGKKPWPELFEESNPLCFHVINESCDGRTTRYDSGECNGLGVILKKLATHSPLDCVVIMLGTNDVKDKYGPPSPIEIAGGMHQILEIIDNHGGGARPILLTPPPLGNVISGELARAQRRIPPVAAGYRLLARDLDIRIVDIYSIINVATDLEADMVHLNAAGRRKVAEAVLTNLQRNEST
jgi:lysophospholipase L1-like esterase